MRPIKRKRGLTEKEMIAVKELAMGSTKRAAIQKAYGYKNVRICDNAAQQVFDRPVVQDELKFYRDQQRTELLPMAMKRLNDVLNAHPKKEPSWESVIKVAQGITAETINKAKEADHAGQINFISKFINLSNAPEGIIKPLSVKQYKPRLSKSMPGVEEAELVAEEQEELGEGEQENL